MIILYDFADNLLVMGYVIEDIDDIDKRIIYELDLNCRIPETKLAKIVGRSKESVSYRIKRLRADGVITKFGTMINLTKVGFEAMKIYLRVREKKKLMELFTSHYLQRQDVFWFGKGDGSWNIGLTFFARNSKDFFWIKNELFSNFKELVIEQVVGSVVENYSFGKKFLLNDEKIEPKEVLFLGAKEEGAVGEKDKQILECLLIDGRMSYVDIASRVGCYPEFARNRIKELEERKIISMHSISIDYKKIGYEFYKTYIYFEGFTKAHEKRFYELACRHPNVLYYLKVLAPWDAELEIMAKNYHEYNRIVNYFREQFSDVLVQVQTTALDVDALFPSEKLPIIRT